VFSRRPWAAFTPISDGLCPPPSRSTNFFSYFRRKPNRGLEADRRVQMAFGPSGFVPVNEFDFR
jgi:hypothetical protein